MTWLLALCLGASAHAVSALPAAPSSPPAQSVAQDNRHLGLAIPASALVGFGLGHVVQDRLAGYAWAFPVTDAVGYGLIVSSLKDCPGACSRRGALNAGLGLVIASRLVQLADVALFKGAEVAVLPSPQRPQILGGIRF